MKRVLLAARIAVMLLAVGMLALSGCGIARLVDSNTSNAWKAGESADALTSNANDCPNAKKEIADAKAAGAAAKEAGDALDRVGHALDEARDAHRKADQEHEKLNNERSAKQQEADAAQNIYKEADAPYLKADEEYQGAVLQATLAGIDASQTSGDSLDATWKRMQAGAQVPMALGKAAEAKVRRDAIREKNRNKVEHLRDKAKEMAKRADAMYQPTVKAKEARDAAKVKMDQAQAAYDGAEDDAIAKTKASKAANRALLEACPKARRGLETPQSKSRGLDVFDKTKGQHQEPGH